MTDRFRILKDVVSYSSSAVFGQALGLVSGALVAKLLGPTEFGTWNAVSLALVYGAYFDIGILPAMARDVPIHRGQGDPARAKEIEGTAFTTTFVGALLVAVILVAISLLPGQPKSTVFGLRGMAIVIVPQRLYAYYQTILRCYNEFGLLSRLQVIFAAVSAVLAVLLVLQFGFEGRVVAAAVAQFLVLAYVGSIWKLDGFFRFSLPVAAQLARTGVPIIVSSVVIGFLTTIDRLMIVTCLGPTELGYFGVSLMITGIVFLIPWAASQVIYPRLTHRFGESGKDLLPLKNYVLLPTILTAYLVPVLIGVIYLTLPAVVELLLPQYTPGIVAGRIVLIGMFFFSIVGVTDYFLVTIGKLRQYVLLACLALALNGVLDLLFLVMGMGINGVALGGTAITYFCYAVALVGYALSHYTRRSADWARFFAKLLLPFAYMVVLLAALERLVVLDRADRTFERFVILGSRLTLFLLGCLPLVYAASREVKMGSLSTAMAAWRGR